MKIISGAEGMHAKKIARAIKKLGRVPKLKEAYKMAFDLGFSSPRSLVVMGEKRSEFDTTNVGRLGPLYRKTFQQPRFNPRWKYGTADHIAVVKL